MDWQQNYFSRNLIGRVSIGCDTVPQTMPSSIPICPMHLSRYEWRPVCHATVAEMVSTLHYYYWHLSLSSILVVWTLDRFFAVATSTIDSLPLTNPCNWCRTDFYWPNPHATHSPSRANTLASCRMCSKVKCHLCSRTRQPHNRLVSISFPVRVPVNRESLWHLISSCETIRDRR